MKLQDLKRENKPLRSCEPCANDRFEALDGQETMRPGSVVLVDAPGGATYMVVGQDGKLRDFGDFWEGT